MKVDVVLRRADDNDKAFIFKSWLVNFRASNHLEGLMDAKTYFDNQTNLIERILAGYQSIVTLAVSPEDDNQIFGYLVTQQVKDLRVIHYAYVKAPYRRLGIASFIKEFVYPSDDCGDIPIVATHHTRMTHVLKIKWNMVFNPYLLLDF